MKVAFVLLLALQFSTGVLLAAPQAASQVGNSTSSGSDSRDAEIRKLNAAEVQAFLDKDAKAMAALWSDDFVVTNPLNKFVTKMQVLKMVDSGFLIITAYDRQIEYLKLYGDTAIVAGNETVQWGGKMPNAGKTEHLRFTAIWMKQDGHWRQIARHANVVPQP
jgi:uncharacterized protein (TIGR02246 family)